MLADEQNFKTHSQFAIISFARMFLSIQVTVLAAVCGIVVIAIQSYVIRHYAYVGKYWRSKI